MAEMMLAADVMNNRDDFTLYFFHGPGVTAPPPQSASGVAFTFLKA